MSLVKIGKVTMEVWYSDLAQTWMCRIERRTSPFWFDVLGEGTGSREEAVREAVVEARVRRRARQIARAV